MKRGDIVWAAPEPHVGHEQALRRPVLIVSSDYALTAVPHVVTTIPLTTRKRPWSTRVPVTGPKTGLDRESWAICEQVRTISTDRLGEAIGTANAKTVERVDRRLRYLLNLP